MAIKIITDSSSDLDYNYIDNNNIGIIPLNIIFGERSFIPREELSIEQFYELLELSTELPKTAQPSPAVIEGIFKKSIDQGDDVVAIHISSNMSGVYNTSVMIKNQMGCENIYICDSRTVTFALGLLVMEAVKMRDAGKTAKEIFEEIEQLKERVVLLASIGNLKYLQMGGRLSPGTAFIGAMLNFKPIITIKDGLVEVIGKQRGQKRANESILKLVGKYGINENYTKFFAHTHMPSIMHEFMDYFKPAFPRIKTDEFELCNIGSTVGVHAGPGATGISFVAINPIE